jgi:hypothetical protein
VKEYFGGGETLFDEGVIGEMVEMAVSQPKADEVPAALGGFFEKAVGGVIGSIEEDGLFGGIVGDEEAVGHGDAAGIGEDEHVLRDGNFEEKGLRVISAGVGLCVINPLTLDPSPSDGERENLR